MLTLVPDAIETYAAEHSDPVPDLLEELRVETVAKTTAPQMQVGRIEGNFLKLLCQLSNAKRVVEFGTFTGYSALMMAAGLPEGGEVFTLDVDEQTGAIAQRFFDRSPHGKKIRRVMGPALETLKTLKGPFDLAFIDADKQNYSNYYEAVLPMLRPGGLVVGDNTLWSGKVLSPKDESDHAIRAFNDKVSADPRVEKVLLTVRDGMMLARKR